MSGVELGPDGRPVELAGSGLLLPGYEYVVGRCLVPGCGRVFREGEETKWEKHVGECARANMDAIRELSAAIKSGPFGDYDPEVTAHLKRVGKRMLREGRFEVKPNERAGY